MTQCSSPAAAGGVDWLPRREKKTRGPWEGCGNLSLFGTSGRCDKLNLDQGMESR